MNCQNCQGLTRVKETRQLTENTTWVKRKRYCPECKNHFWTVEMPVDQVEIQGENHE